MTSPDDASPLPGDEPRAASDTVPGPRLARPFSGLHYQPASVRLERVTAAAPDLWDTEFVVGQRGRDPHNVIHLLAPLLSSTTPPDGPGAAAQLVSQWLNDGVLSTDTDPAMYLYAYGTPGQMHRGLVVDLPAGEPGGAPLMPHEEVSAATVQRQLDLIDATNAQFEPILVVIQGSMTYHQLLDQVMTLRPLWRFQSEDGADHAIWAIRSPEMVAQLADLTAGIPMLLADGHHRYVALQRSLARPVRSPGDGREHMQQAVATGPDTRPGTGPRRPPGAVVMLMDADHDGLRLGSIQRVVRGLDWERVLSTPGVTVAEITGAEQALTLLAPRAHGDGAVGAVDGAVGAETDQAVITDGRRWVSLTVRAEGQGHPATVVSEPSAAPELAVCQLHARWLPAWRLGAHAVTYVHDVARAVSLATDTGGMAVLLSPPPVDAVFATAGRGGVLPHKATSFGPKPRIGVMMRQW